MTLFNLRSTGSAARDGTADNRAQQRTAVIIALTLIHENIELAGCHARNISSKGIYIELPSDLPSTSGTPVTLRFHIWTGRDHMTRFLRAMIIRSGLRFLAAGFTDHELITNAVVQDIHYYQQHERRLGARAMVQRLPFGANLTVWLARLIS